MGHDDDRARSVAQKRLERLARRDVEVVRRLVEQQQVGCLQPDERKLEARPLAARELLDGLEHVLATKQEARQVRPRRSLVHAAAVGQCLEHGRARAWAPARIWAR